MYCRSYGIRLGTPAAFPLTMCREYFRGEITKITEIESEAQGRSTECIQILTIFAHPSLVSGLVTRRDLLAHEIGPLQFCKVNVKVFHKNPNANRHFQKIKRHLLNSIIDEMHESKMMIMKLMISIFDYVCRSFVLHP